MSFEVLHPADQVPRFGYEMEMVFHQHIGVETQFLLFATEQERFQHDFAWSRAGKNGQPVYNCDCQEVYAFGFGNGVSGSHGDMIGHRG